MSTRDCNITRMLRWELDLNFHQFQTVERALSCVIDPDVMDNLSLVVHHTMPQGDYICFPFQSSDALRAGPCFFLLTSS